MANETNHSNCQLFSTAIPFLRCKGKGKSFIIIMKKKNKRRSGVDRIAELVKLMYFFLFPDVFLITFQSILIKL